MDKANEQRAEQRLTYGWPVHFTRDDREKAFPGQIVDVSSQAIAFLCHADENCPHPGQLLTTNFGAPHFDRSNSFDTVLFNRIGRVSRLDELSSQVRRVVVQFTAPLFFRPGEQDIRESDAQNRLEKKAVTIIQAEEKAKVYNEALTRAEDRIKFYSETKVKAEARAKFEAQARAKAEARAKSEAKLRAKAEKQAKTEAERRAKIEAQAQKRGQSYVDEMAKMKAETAQTIAQIKAEAAGIIAKIEEELKIKGNVEIQTTNKQPIKEVVLKKVDKFVKDRNKIF